MGADVTGRRGGTLPPLVVRGRPLRGVHIETPVASAQVKSALLLAGLAADGPTTVVEPARSRDHTERLLGAMGARIEVAGTAVTVTPPDGDLNPVDVTVPGDVSTAAVWIVAATLHPDAELLLTGVGVNPTRTGLLDILREMGADIELLDQRTSGGEPVADLLVRSAELHGVEVGGELVPRAIDELPLVVLAGALADGQTVIRDAAELRVKESDRISTTAATLRAFGARVEERPDGMVVEGGGRLHGAHIGSSGDHRLAMLGAVAGLLADEETVIEGAGTVSVSYPEFWTDLGRAGATSEAVRG
jgi:3-phosphoshikimate 1-carboxyvinyltransferase